MRKHQPTHPVSPLVKETLSDEHWYGDDPPLWLNSRSAAEAEEARHFTVKRLRRFSSPYPEAADLAGVLERCKPDRRCMSGACPECLRAIQRWFVKNVRDLITRTDLLAVSLVCPWCTPELGQLGVLNLTEQRRHLARMKLSETGWVAGGFDISLNDDAAKGTASYWQLQLYATATGINRKALSEQVRSLRERYTYRPLQVKASDGSNEAISYALKTVFLRRVSYRTTRTLKSGRESTSWNTRKMSLRAREHVELLIWLHNMGIHRRLYFRGVRMTRTANGVRLVQIRKLE